MHLHINEGKPADDGKSAKVWIYSTGEIDIVKRGIYESKDLEDKFQTLLKILAANIEKAKQEWSKRAGGIVYFDIVEKKKKE